MDKRGFAEEVEAIKGRLYRTAYLYLGNEASAMEAVDESVYKAWRARKSLKQPEYFATWLTRILINECKRELGRAGRLQVQEVLPEEAAEAYDALPLKEAVGRLPEELRAVIILRYFADYTLAQTAQVLEVPQGTVVTRVRRALALLRLDLQEEGEGWND